MYMNQKDLLWDIDKGFVKEIIDMAKKESREKGDFLFHEGDSAESLYILIKGHVKLTIAYSGHTVYVANHPGEVFGWSSIVGRDVYSASAQCVEQTNLRKVNKDDFLRLAKKDPENGMNFFMKISQMLGNRLLHSYRLSSGDDASLSYGTGQIQEFIEAA